MVTSIENSAFKDCSGLTSVTIGKSMTSIGGSAFGNCKSIEKVISLNTTPPAIESSTFVSEVEKSATLHVQKGSLVYYWLDPMWKEFLNIDEDILCLEAIPDATYGDGEIDLARYAPNGVALSYETSNDDVVRIEGTKMSIVGAGTATVGAILDEEGTPMQIIGQMRQFNVDQAELTISVFDIEIAEGDPLPDFSYLVEGLQYDDTLDDIEELPKPVCDVTEDSPAGEYPIKFTDGHDRNYYFTTRPAKVIISTKTIIEPIVESNSDEYVKIYDLNGVMIYEGLRSEAHLKKGIYIVNNDKISIKIYVK